MGDRKNGKNRKITHAAAHHHRPPAPEASETADQPTLPVEGLSAAPPPLNLDGARQGWRVELMAGVLALPFTAARYLLNGFARTGQRLRRLRHSFQQRGEHVWHDWLGRGHGPVRRV